MPPTETILDILRAAYALEVEGYTFYSVTAEQATKPAVAELFARLAADEQQHQVYLREVGEHYTAKGPAAFQIDVQPPELEAFLTRVFTKQFVDDARAAGFEASALAFGMTLETNAIAAYSRAAGSATDDRIRDFYLFLADWERQHLQALENAYNAMRGDFWGRGGFGPAGRSGKGEGGK